MRWTKGWWTQGGWDRVVRHLYCPGKHWKHAQLVVAQVDRLERCHCQQHRRHLHQAVVAFLNTIGSKGVPSEHVRMHAYKEKCHADCHAAVDCSATSKKNITSHLMGSAMPNQLGRSVARCTPAPPYHQCPLERESERVARRYKVEWTVV